MTRKRGRYSNRNDFAFARNYMRLELAKLRIIQALVRLTGDRGSRILAWKGGRYRHRDNFPFAGNYTPVKSAEALHEVTDHTNL